MTAEELANIALDSDQNQTVDWTHSDRPREEIYNMMAQEVINMFTSLPEENRFAVSLATNVHLLAERYAIVAKYQIEDGNDNV